jgi:outer membrane protein insertion porin family
VIPDGRFTKLVLLMLLASVRVVAAQDSLLELRPDAQVGSVDFRFPDTQSFSAVELGSHLAVKSRGSLYNVRHLLGELPLIPTPGRYEFDPVELQKDVVRLRRFYQRAGFFDPRIDYQVRANESGTVVKVVYVIEEGPAAPLRSLEITGFGVPGQPALPDSLRQSWRGLEAELARGQGRRFGEADLDSVQFRTTAWLRAHGYPFARVRASQNVDSVNRAVDVALQVDPGPRSRFGRITVEGNRSVSDRVVLRELPFATGDWYSAEAVVAGRKRLQAVDLLAQAVVDVDSAPTPDSALSVTVRVQETRPRLTLAEVGYISEGAGLTGRVQWTHPNFTGGARSLAASLEGQSGAGAIGTEAEQLLRGSLSVTQPYVFAPGYSLIVGPYAEYRNDLQDRSAAIGLNATLVRRLAGLSSIALQYQFSARHIYEYHFGDVSAGDINLLELLAAQYPPLIDSLGHDENKSTLTLAGSFNYVDDLANPRRGWLIRPSVEVTVPGAFSTTQFARTDLSVSRFQPLSRNLVLAARLSAGRMFPFGKSVPTAGSDPTFSFIRLRDESMTAGGTNDVRGWGDRQLGPKVPDVEANIVGTDTVFVADRYAPIGALARVSGSVELRFPAPGLTPAWRMNVFVDGGRVWTPDERFSQALLLPQNTPFRFSIGTGISYQTAVGALGLSLGYKLNPSDVDVRDPGKVLDAFIAGSPVTSVDPQWWRYWHLHFSLGVAL